MTYIKFPSNPTINQTYTHNDKTWIWTGYAWAVKPQPLNFVSIVNALGYIPPSSKEVSNTSLTIYNTTNSAFAQANTSNLNAIGAFTLANTVDLVSNGAFTQANVANDTATGAFAKANSMLSSNGGTITGNVTVTDTIFAKDFDNISDINFKYDVEDLPSAIEIVNQMHGVGFKWKNTGNPAYGVIAQEMANVVPELVHTMPDGTKAVNYNGIIAFLIESIKEINKRLDKLEG